MKKLLLSLIGLRKASNNTHNSNKSDVTTEKNVIVKEEYDAKVQILDCEFNKPIPEGYNIGKVVVYKGNTNEEANMLNQFESYNTALLRGDIDNAIHYMYPDTVVYFRKFYPQETDDAIMHKFFERVSKTMIGQINRFRNHGVELEIVVSRIIRKVTQGGNIFFVFEIVSNMYNDNLQLHTTPDLTLAISINGGKNWTFSAMNNDTPNILRVSFSDEVVDSVMGY